MTLAGCSGRQTTAATTAAATTAAATTTAAAAAEAVQHTVPDYSVRANWAYWSEGEGKDADLFLICPTVDMRDEYNMSMEDEETKSSFLGALNMERGIYEDDTRMFAPYYEQGAMKIYELEEAEREPYLQLAYEDVSAAFSYYLEHENEGRPIILAGFSQGADMCYRLLREYFGSEELYGQLTAVYAIGWPLTQEMTDAYPQLKAAQGEDDTGVIISFECESPEVEESFIVPSGTKMLSINPLNWKTDGTPASKEENPGACFTNYEGSIVSEIPGLCGAYIDGTRGTLKVTDITPGDYPPVVPGLPEGEYHVYDYQFFFRSLQENVGVRLESYLESAS